MKPPLVEARTKLKPIIYLLAALGFCLAPFPLGLPIVIITITPAAVCLCLGALFTFLDRMLERRSLAPPEFFKCPAVIACMIYFVIGLFSGIFALNQLAYAKEVMQRTLIIVVPLYLYTLGPKHLREIKDFLFYYIYVCMFLAVVALSAAVHLGFLQPVFLPEMDLHKNAIAANFAVMGSISLAGYLSSRVKIRKSFFMFSYLLAFISILAVQGRAAMLSLIVSSTVVAVVAGVKMRKIFLSIASIALTLYLAIAFVLPENVAHYFFNQNKFSSNDERIQIWSLIFDYVSHHPFSGVGWGNSLYVNEHLEIIDAVNVILYDWMQLSIVGVLALITMIVCSIAVPLSNQRKLKRFCLASFVNLSALGMLTARFTHAQLDAFWIGRGPTLVTFAALGMAIWVSLMIKYRKVLSTIGDTRAKIIIKEPK